MPKRKTDTELSEEISMHSETARDLLRKSHKIHEEALNAEFTTEHIQIMRQVIEFQRLAIKETKIVTRLQKILLNRQMKMMNKERADMQK